MYEYIFIIKNYLKGMEFSSNHQMSFEINYEQTKEFYKSIHELLNEKDRLRIQIERLKKDREILYGVIDELKEDNDGDHIPRID